MSNYLCQLAKINIGVDGEGSPANTTTRNASGFIHEPKK
jgi:hypothetical protein